MKDKIIKILQENTVNMSDEGGTAYTVVEDSNFDDIAEQIILLFDEQFE